MREEGDHSISEMSALTSITFAERAGNCDVCDHGEHLAHHKSRVAVFGSARAARCSQIVGADDWAASGGVGYVAQCDCRAAFHGS